MFGETNYFIGIYYVNGLKQTYVKLAITAIAPGVAYKRPWTGTRAVFLLAFSMFGNEDLAKWISSLLI